MQASDVLLQTYQFTDEDLIANRAGRLTSLQKVRLRQRFYEHYFHWQLWAWLGVVLIACCSCWFIPYIDNPTSPLSLLCGAGFFGLIGWSIYWIIQAQMRWMGEMGGEPQVEKICAPVRPQQTDLLIPQIYTLHFDRLSFRVSERQFQVVQEGRSYCVYYLPRLRMIVSIEVME